MASLPQYACDEEQYDWIFGPGEETENAGVFFNRGSHGEGNPEMCMDCNADQIETVTPGNAGEEVGTRTDTQLPQHLRSVTREPTATHVFTPQNPRINALGPSPPGMIYCAGCGDLVRYHKACGAHKMHCRACCNARHSPGDVDTQKASSSTIGTGRPGMLGQHKLRDDVEWKQEVHHDEDVDPAVELIPLFVSPSEVRQFLSQHHPKDYIGFKVADDDADEAKEAFSFIFAELAAALLNPYAPVEQSLNAAGKQRYIDNQQDAIRTILQEISTKVGREWASANISNIIYEIIDVNTLGIPKRLIRDLAESRGIEPDYALKTMERVRRVIEVTKLDKTVALDIVLGINVGDLARNPDAFAKRKKESAITDEASTENKITLSDDQGLSTHSIKAASRAPAARKP